MSKTLSPAFCLILLCCSAPQAFAHYLWVALDSDDDQRGTAVIYFEESPAPGDGHYLDHFTESGKVCFRTVEQIEPEQVKITDVHKGAKRWLTAPVPGEAPRDVSMYGKFGVYQYGQTNVLLHYYARNLDVQTHEDLHELARAEHMDLDIVVHDSEGTVELRVLWKGKSAADRMVYIRGPEQFRKNVKTDRFGRVSFPLIAAGKYTFRTSVEEATPGTENGEDYSLIRHNATLIMRLPLEK